MGRICNHVTLVHDYGNELREVRKKAIELFEPLFVKRAGSTKVDGEFVSEIFTSVTNGEEFFIVGTDGSKSGWETNNEFERVRKEFLEYCEDVDVYQVATIEFGDIDNPRLVSY